MIEKRPGQPDSRGHFGEFGGQFVSDALVACVGGGSNAMGLFHPFIDDTDVQMFGVEAAGGTKMCKRSPSLKA